MMDKAFNPMNNKNIIKGIVIAVTCGAMCSFEFFNGFTLRLIDIVELFIIFLVIKKLFFVSSKLSYGLLPLGLSLSYCFFFAALISCPLFGILMYGMEPSMLTPSVRFLALSLLIYLCFQLKISGKMAFNELHKALFFAVVVNFFYAILQQMEFLRVIPFGTLPHHRLTVFFS